MIFINILQYDYDIVTHITQNTVEHTIPIQYTRLYTG